MVESKTFLVLISGTYEGSYRVVNSTIVSPEDLTQKYPGKLGVLHVAAVPDNRDPGGPT